MIIILFFFFVYKGTKVYTELWALQGVWGVQELKSRVCSLSGLLLFVQGLRELAT